MVAYRTVEGFLGYRVGDDGTVWSCKRGRWGLSPTWRQMKTPIDSVGYPHTVLMRDRRPVKFRVHELVLLCFVGLRPKSMDACHCNGNRLDNRAVNLRWDTRKENWRDTLKHGTRVRGERVKNARLSENDVREIRRLRGSGEMGIRRLAKRYDVAPGTIQSVLKGKSWAHVS